MVGFVRRLIFLRRLGLKNHTTIRKPTFVGDSAA
jgi:hypothetical protein